MGSENIIVDSFSLLFLGMGTVFVFLTILVFVTTLMSSLVQRYVVEAGTPELKADTTFGQDQDKLLTVITAAIHVHRSRNK